MQALIQHSKKKDQFLKVAIKCMAEAHLFEDELKEANELNSILFVDKQSLEAKIAEETQAKNGNLLLVLLYLWFDHVRADSELNSPLPCSI
jgi:hypothetical protein